MKLELRIIYKIKKFGFFYYIWFVFSDEYLQTELQELGDLAAEDRIGSIRVQRNAEQSQNQDVTDDYFKCKHKNLKVSTETTKHFADSCCLDVI